MNGRRRQRFGTQCLVYCVVLLLVFEGSNALFNKDDYEPLKKFNKNVKKTNRITKGSNRSLRGNSKFMEGHFLWFGREVLIWTRKLVWKYALKDDIGWSCIVFSRSSVCPLLYFTRFTHFCYSQTWFNRIEKKGKEGKAGKVVKDIIITLVQDGRAMEHTLAVLLFLLRIKALPWMMARTTIAIMRYMAMDKPVLTCILLHRVVVEGR